MSIRRLSGDPWRPRSRGRRRRRARPRLTFRGRVLLAVLAAAALAVAGAAVLRPSPFWSSPDADYEGPLGGGRAVRLPPDIDPAWYGAAPYVMPLGGPALPSVMDSTGQRTFQLAFILASGDRCSPAWDGTRPVGPDGRVAGIIDDVRAHGGDVSVSLGGGAGTRLGQVCRDEAATADAYQEVIDRYHLRAVDLDLEDPEWRDDGAVAREIGAMKLLQDRNPHLYISLTLPMLQNRVPERAAHVLTVARSLGFLPDTISVMPFNFHGQGPMADAAVEALEAMHDQLVSTFGWSAAEAYAREGASLMNGRTDHGEFFTTDDFRAVLDYSTAHRLGRFTFWSLNRDRQCATVDNGGKTSGGCSSIAQDALAFTRFTAEFGSRATAWHVTPAPQPTASASARTAAAPAQTVTAPKPTPARSGRPSPSAQAPSKPAPTGR